MYAQRCVHEEYDKLYERLRQEATRARLPSLSALSATELTVTTKVSVGQRALDRAERERGNRTRGAGGGGGFSTASRM